MDFKKPDNIIEFIKFQKKILRKYKNHITNTMASSYKKAAIFVYWLNDYIDYIKSESTFNPSWNINYKRGQIVFVNFGYRIGTELGGNHYAVVLDVKNSRSSKTLTVIPLKSKKDKETAYSKIYHVPLGECVKALLYQKATKIVSYNFNKAHSVAVDIAKIGVEKAKQDPQISKELTTLKRNRRIAENILAYTDKLKSESVADAGQIITISKQRINHPCKNNDVLAGVILPDNYMSEIENKIRKLYVGI